MISLLLHLLRLLPFLLGGHRQLALENLALRQQLAVYKRTVTRPPLRRRDRVFWVGLASVWAGWKLSLVIVTRTLSGGGSGVAFARTGRFSLAARPEVARPSTPRSGLWSGAWPRRIHSGVHHASMPSSSSSASPSRSVPFPDCCRSGAHRHPRRGGRSSPITSGISSPSISSRYPRQACAYSSFSVVL